MDYIPDIQRDKTFFAHDPERLLESNGFRLLVAEGTDVGLLESINPWLIMEETEIPQKESLTINGITWKIKRETVTSRSHLDFPIFSLHSDSSSLYFKPINPDAYDRNYHQTRFDLVGKSLSSLVHQMSVPHALQTVIDKQSIDGFEVKVEKVMGAYINKQGMKYMVTQGVSNSVDYEELEDLGGEWEVLYKEIAAVRVKINDAFIKERGYIFEDDVDFLIQLPEEYNALDLDSLRHMKPPIKPYRITIIDLEKVYPYKRPQDNVIVINEDME